MEFKKYIFLLCLANKYLTQQLCGSHTISFFEYWGILKQPSRLSKLLMRILKLLYNVLFFILYLNYYVLYCILKLKNLSYYLNFVRYPL